MASAAMTPGTGTEGSRQAWGQVDGNVAVAERTGVPAPLSVVLMDRVIGTAGHEQLERRASVQFGDGGGMQAGWEMMEI